MTEHTLKTTGEPYAVKLDVDRNNVSANREDLVFITAEIVDQNGLVVPNADCVVEFKIDNGLEIRAVDNGDPEYIGSLQANSIPALSGMCLCVVGPKGKKGEFCVIAKSQKLLSNTVKISIKG